MPRKLFISYRRQDSAANALGIGQYFENVFGRKNVFIDVDMHAGTKFPALLEKRLSECKVMLVLIGQDWLNARDDQGQRRLDNSDDWVRLEISHALTRDITVIPVRVNSAELPIKATLPDDIRGLLDYQAVSVTTTGFRHEMSGLVRDIKSIPSPRSWRRFGAIAAGIVFLLTGTALYQAFGLSGVIDRVRLLLVSTKPAIAKQNGIWSSDPGEWVMYGVDQQPVAYYFKPSSVLTFGDRVAYTARFPFKSINTTTPEDTITGVYEDDSTVVDCKQSVALLTERSIYNKFGESISHYKRANPESLDMSTGQPIKSNTIISNAERILCDEQLRTPLSKQVVNAKLSYLAATLNGDGDIVYGPTKRIADSGYQFESSFVVRFREDHRLADIFPGQTIIGLPSSYRSLAESLQLNCEDRTLQSRKIEYFDQQNNLVYLAPLIPVQPMDGGKEGSPFNVLLSAICGAPVPKVGGKYEGTINTTYDKGGGGEQRLSIIVEQIGSRVDVSFQTPVGEQGKGTGTLKGGTIESMSLRSAAPGCPASYEASLNFSGDEVSWSFKGEDCGGPMQGHGTAKRTKG
jgi:TIR domain